jgi:hypothetical protein
MMVSIVNRWKQQGEPRHGLCNPYKSRAKAQRMAQVLTRLHKRLGWRYSVLELENNPVTWIVRKEGDMPEGKPQCWIEGEVDVVAVD